MVTVYKVRNIGMLFAVKTELSKTVFFQITCLLGVQQNNGVCDQLFYD